MGTVHGRHRINNNHRKQKIQQPPPNHQSSSSTNQNPVNHPPFQNPHPPNMLSLPYGQVDSSLRGLAGQAEGFGRFAIGGLHGALYHVTTLADDGPGSLRDGCRKKEPLWIVFEVSGTIQLSSYLSVSSYKTIDGRGQRVKFTGKGLRLKECEHVIICNMEFDGGRGPDVDAIQIKPNSKYIWIDRCSLRDYDDGLIDITRESTDITISRCHFSGHDKTILIGGDASHIGDRCIRVTIHHCFFDGTRQRHPRVRYGKVHLYNNYTRDWGIYAVCASVDAQIYSQCNIYEAGLKKGTFKYLPEKAADREEPSCGWVISEGDIYLNGAQICLPKDAINCQTFHPSEFYPTWTAEAPSESLKEVLRHCTGWQSVPKILIEQPHGVSNNPAVQKVNPSLLPYAHVDSSLRSLSAQAEGFGRFAIGGLHGPLYHVTTLEDDGPGSLRDGCRRQEPLWVVFDVSGTIHLSSYLNVSSYKTVDGRGQRIKLTGKGLRLKQCEHVIICNLEFEGGRGHDVDGIQIKPNSKHIWIDRCSLRDYDDGLIDITRESTDITVSRCHFAGHDKTMLIGADPTHIGDRCIRVTIHHCFFDGTRQRHPRVRYGKVHLYNNYTRDWGIYAVCASVEAQIYSQCNIYEAGLKKGTFKYLPEKAADKEEISSGYIVSESDAYLNGAQPCVPREAIKCNTFHPSEFYPTWTTEIPSESLKAILQRCTGWQSLPRPVDQKIATY